MANQEIRNLCKDTTTEDSMWKWEVCVDGVIIDGGFHTGIAGYGVYYTSWEPYKIHEIRSNYQFRPTSSRDEMLERLNKIDFSREISKRRPA